MKKTIIFLLAITTFASLAFGNDAPVTPKELEKSLITNFPGIKDFTWQKKDDVYIADFREDGIRHFAYFDAAANFLGVVRYITTDNMPFKLVNEVKKRFGNFGKANAVEITVANEETTYFMNVIHKDKFKAIKVHSDGAIEFIKH
jgi:hypothetical protein